jgi:hypothetical protein
MWQHCQEKCQIRKGNCCQLLLGKMPAILEKIEKTKSFARFRISGDESTKIFRPLPITPTIFDKLWDLLEYSTCKLHWKNIAKKEIIQFGGGQSKGTIRKTSTVPLN